MPFRTTFRLLFLASIAALVAPLVSAAERVFDVTGIIRARLDDGRLVIAHDEIKGFMRAMTMAFNIADPADVTCLAPGDRVRFRFRVGEQRSVAGSFQITGRESTPAAYAPTAAAAKRSRLRVGDPVPDFALVDQHDQPFMPDELRGRFTLVTFIFTRCPVPEYCPTMALRFGQLQQAIEADTELTARTRLLSITLDPEFDRPEILKAYGEAVGAKPTLWHFATGEKSDIDALAKAFAVYTERNGVTLDHSLCTSLIGPDGRVLELWRGNGWRIDEVLTALRQAH